MGTRIVLYSSVSNRMKVTGIRVPYKTQRRIVRTNLVRGILANPYSEESQLSNEGRRVDICAALTISGIAVI